MIQIYYYPNRITIIETIGNKKICKILNLETNKVVDLEILGYSLSDKSPMKLIYEVD